MSRRAVLCVPATDPRRIVKAMQTEADEVVIDLEDAVPPNRKVEARGNIASVVGRQQGSISVRVNSHRSSWIVDDLDAVVANPWVASVVVPKVESATQIGEVVSLLADLETKVGRTRPVKVQALIESARGLVNAIHIAAASERIDALILGYADLGASLGRRPEAPWGFAQDTVLLAARCGGVAAIDGPLLTVGDDQALAVAATTTEARGFDGKWVIHPRQISTVQSAFTPSVEEIRTARAIIDALERAAQEGRGAVEWQGRMLDEAVAVQARRVLAKVGS